ncbi:MAG: hypothetical protein ACSLEM_03550 [Candidatus Malihini olakiniferum]
MAHTDVNPIFNPEEVRLATLPGKKHSMVDECLMLIAQRVQELLEQWDWRSV